MTNRIDPAMQAQDTILLEHLHAPLLADVPHLTRPDASTITRIGWRRHGGSHRELLVDEFPSRMQETDAARLRRKRREVLPQEGAYVLVDGERMLGFCSNDYLVLARHPALIQAACKSAIECPAMAEIPHLIDSVLS